jgi:GNAT superfamily N-acetyltransferase
MTQVGTVEYTPARRGDVAELLAEVWDDPLAGTGIEWWFERSSRGPGVLALAEVDGRLAGSVGMTYVRMRVGEAEEPVALALKFATRREYRGRGVFSTLLRAAEEESASRGALLAFSIPNRMSLPQLLRLGWRRLGAQRVWVRPLLGGRRRSSRSRGGVEVVAIERFGEEAEQAWLASASGSARVVPDAAYLNWRYVDTPHDYRRFAAGDRGYAVVRRMRARGLDTGMVCTVVAVDARVRRALLDRCAEEVRGARVLAVLRPPGRVVPWLAAGFLPSPRALSIVGKQLAEGAELPPRPVFEFGDHDLV